MLAAPPEAGGQLDIVKVPTDATDLLTLREVRRIQRADLVLYDPGIPPDVLDHARRDAVLRAVSDLTHRTDEEAATAVANGDAVVALLPSSGIPGCATS
jgi:precorrin-4 methylase